MLPGSSYSVEYVRFPNNMIQGVSAEVSEKQDAGRAVIEAIIAPQAMRKITGQRSGKHQERLRQCSASLPIVGT